MYEYKGFAAKIWWDGAMWIGMIYGLEITIEAETKEDCLKKFYAVADKHMLDPD